MWADTRLSWSFHAEKLYNLVVGVAREDAEATRMLGSDDRGWGYFVTLGSGQGGCWLERGCVCAWPTC